MTQVVLNTLTITSDVIVLTDEDKAQKGQDTCLKAQIVNKWEQTQTILVCPKGMLFLVFFLSLWMKANVEFCLCYEFIHSKMLWYLLTSQLS